MTDPRIPDDDPRLRDAIARLPQEIPPARDLWPEIRAELEADRVRALPGSEIASDAPGVRRFARAARWPELAAAALVLIVATAGITWQVIRSTSSAPPSVVVELPPSDAPVGGAAAFARFASYERWTAELSTALDQRSATLDPETRAVLEKSLRTIDEALSEARAALERDPSSSAIRDYVESAYRHKLDFLRRANDVAALRGA